MGHHLVWIHMENHHGNEVLQLNEMDHVFFYYSVRNNTGEYAIPTAKLPPSGMFVG